MIQQIEFQLPPFPKGFHLITEEITGHLPALPDQGLLHLFLKHTSAGLCINENADPTVRADFDKVFDQIIPEGLPYIEHTLEGDDDLPAHIKSTLTGHSITIPIANSRLDLGIWQGIYLCEFRRHGGSRNCVATILF